MARQARQSVTPELRDDIATRALVFGQNYDQIKTDLAVSEDTISYTLRVLNLVQEEKWETLIEYYDSRTPGINVLTWALGRTRKTAPAGVYEACSRASQKYNKKGIPEPEKNEPAPEEKPFQSSPYAVEKLILMVNAIGQWQQDIHSAIQSGFDSVIDAINALASDLKDNTNVNSDLVAQRLKETNDILTGIKCNTRKRGL